MAYTKMASTNLKPVKGGAIEGHNDDHGATFRYVEREGKHYLIIEVELSDKDRKDEPLKTREGAKWFRAFLGFASVIVSLFPSKDGKGFRLAMDKYSKG